MNHIIELLTGLIIQVIQMSGYTGIFLLMAAESALIPIPSEITMTFAGYLASTGAMNLWLVIIVGALANLFGSMLAYWLGHWGGENVVRELIKKYGKWIFVTVDEYDKSNKWFLKYGEKIAFFSRLLPVVRTFVSLPTGVAKMNFTKFCMFTFIGSFIWSALLAYIGYVLGQNWNSLHPYYQKFEYVIVGGIILLAGYYIWHKFQKISHKK